MKKTLTSFLCAAVSLTLLMLACGDEVVPPPVPLPLEDGGVLWADCDPAQRSSCAAGEVCRFVDFYDRAMCVRACGPQTPCEQPQAACCEAAPEDAGAAGYCLPREVCEAADGGADAGGDAGPVEDTDGGIIIVDGDGGLPPPSDGGADAGPRTDAGTDAGTGVDAGTDAGTVVDAGTDAGIVVDAGVDAGTAIDAGVDAGTVADAGVDAGTVVDAGTDAGTVIDAGVDAGTDAGTGTGYTNIRIMASNLTSGNGQDYDPGHGIRLMQGVKPDVVLIQEFNYEGDTPTDIRRLVDQVGPGFHYYRETNAQIPNGIISRWPIIASGEWTDPEVGNRDFAWARIDIPGPRDLWAVSVHLLTSNAGERNSEAVSLVNRIRTHIPTGDYLAIGGDFNTKSRTESCFTTFAQVVTTTGPHPADRNGNGNTNAGRDDPYDHVLVDQDLRQYQQATVISGPSTSSTFPNGLVLDSRVYTPLSEISPALSNDSGGPSMQHMGVIKDFRVPNF